MSSDFTFDSVVEEGQDGGRPGRGVAAYLGIFFLIIALVAGVGIAGLLFYESDVILPGVVAGSVSIGGRTTSDARAALQAEWNTHTITLQNGEVARTYSPNELGFILDTHATVETAHEQGRSLDSLGDVFTVLTKGEAITPIWYFSPLQAERTLQTLALQVDTLPVNASVSFVNGQAVAVESRPGRVLDIETTLTNLQNNAQQVFISGQASLVITPVEPDFVDATLMVAQANEMLTRPVFIHAYDPVTNETHDWAITPAEWGNWLTLSFNPSNLDAGISWTVDEVEVRDYVNILSAKLAPGSYLDLTTAKLAIVDTILGEPQTVNLRVYHEARTHTVQAGETLSSIAYNYGMPYPWLQHNNPGLTTLSVGQTVLIPSPDDLIPLPVIENKRIIVSITEQRMWAYEEGQLLWEWVISTGIDESPTSPGIFQIQTHEENAYAGNWDLWMPYFMGIYRPVPTIDFMNGFHGFPTRNGSNLLWTSNLGTPVTYGCILVDTDNAISLYEWGEEGIIVEVQP